MDVVERLRQFGPEWSKKFGGHIIPYEVCVQAADEIERLRAALKPFADAVYNDNGDMTINHAGIGIDQFAEAYFVMRDLEK